MMTQQRGGPVTMDMFFSIIMMNIGLLLFLFLVIVGLFLPIQSPAITTTMAFVFPPMMLPQSKTTSLSRHRRATADTATTGLSAVLTTSKKSSTTTAKNYEEDLELTIQVIMNQFKTFDENHEEDDTTLLSLGQEEEKGKEADDDDDVSAMLFEVQQETARRIMLEARLEYEKEATLRKIQYRQEEARRQMMELRFKSQPEIEEASTMKEIDDDKPEVYYGIMEEEIEEVVEDKYIECYQSAMEQLTGMEYRAALARMACAFPPTGQKPTLENIDDVQVLKVDCHQIEIAVVIPADESGQCVAIAIPIEFPSPCCDTTTTTISDNSSIVSCILKQVDKLDDMAMEKLEKEKEEEEEMTESSSEALFSQSVPTPTSSSSATAAELLSSSQISSLANNDDIENYPDWWTEPLGTNPTLVQETNKLKSLLNTDEFQPDLHDIIQQALNNNDMEEYSILKAAISSVGTSGIFLRSFIWMDGQQKSITRIDLPIPFDQNNNKNEASNVDALREYVLGIFES